LPLFTFLRYCFDKKNVKKSNITNYKMFVFWINLFILENFEAKHEPIKLIFKMLSVLNQT